MKIYGDLVLKDGDLIDAILFRFERGPIETDSSLVVEYGKTDKLLGASLLFHSGAILEVDAEVAEEIRSRIGAKDD